MREIRPFLDKLVVLIYHNLLVLQYPIVSPYGIDCPPIYWLNNYRKWLVYTLQEIDWLYRILISMFYQLHNLPLIQILILSYCCIATLLMRLSNGENRQ